ncbi:MAG: serine hydrolase domain-containing protein [Bacteroidota bacterium]
MLMFATIASAQINVETVARLHYSVAADKNKWFEGFQSTVNGSFSPYQSHRSGERRDSAFVARTLGGEAMFTWNTASVPAAWKGDSASFIWACGFGNNLGNEWFELFVNDSATVSFSTVNDAWWSLPGKYGTRLTFTAVARNGYGANLGYMMLTVPRSMLATKKFLTIRIQGRAARDEIWYRMYSYRDVIPTIAKKELQPVYSQIEFIRMGEAVFTLCAPKKLSGKTVQIFDGSKTIAAGTLAADGALSKTSLRIPRSEQPGSGTASIVKLSDTPIDTIEWNTIAGMRIRGFMNEEFTFDKYVFAPGDFPLGRWKNELMVENELGDFPLSISYYDRTFQRVQTAISPGRYGAVIEGKTSSGFTIKRYVTLFCAPVEFDDYSLSVPIQMNPLRGYGIDLKKWKQYSEKELRYSFGSLKYFPQRDPDAAVFLAGLGELDTVNTAFDTPRIRDRQWWITLKRKLEGLDQQENPLSLPKMSEATPEAVFNDTLVQADGYDDQLIKKLRMICSAWSEKGGYPNVTTVVHKGKIIFHESFGKDDTGNPVTKDSPIWMASITKLLTGVLMMQFVDQGIIDLDEPVVRYIPELSGKGNETLTIRQLFTHTSGLHIAGEWASDWNTSLENQIAQLLPTVEIEKSFVYHRVGYALAGKVMERITGQAVPYLFQKQIFSPLGMTSAFSDNTYGGLYCSTVDLAKLGQMLLQKGMLNGTKLFSGQSFDTMLPKKLPMSDRNWGIGTTAMDGDGLSPSAFGHGAASGTVFRIDPTKELIIISARNSVGSSHAEFEKELIRCCVALVQKH